MAREMKRKVAHFDLKPRETDALLCLSAAFSGENE